MVEVKTHLRKTEKFALTPEEITQLLGPRPGLALWSIERLPTGDYQFTFGREDWSEQLIGIERPSSEAL